MPENEKSKLKALSDIASINIDQEFDKILQNILEITCETMKAHSGTIMLVDETTGELRMAASYGLGEDYPKRVHEAAKEAGVPLTYSPSGIVLRAGKHYIVPNVFEEPRDKPWYNLTKELGFSSQIFTPMKRGLGVIGMLNVYMAQVHQFTDEEVDFVTIAASQASSVVQNARICGKLRNNITELNEYKEHLEDKVKNAYKELYESEERYKELFENANDSIYIYDSEGYFKEVNTTALKLLGCTKEEIIGTHISKWITPESLRTTRDTLKKQISGEVMEKPIILEVICKNGEHRWMEIKRRLIKGDDRVVAVHGIGRDITEKRKLEQELEEYRKKLEKSYEELEKSEAKYRDLFENANDVIFTSDAEGYILTANDATVKGFGCNTKGEVIGTHFSDWLTPESIRNAQDHKRKYLGGEPVKQPVIHEFISKNGEHRWAEIRSRVIKEGDKAIGLHCIARDITEKWKLEEKLKESEALYKDLFENADDPMYTHDLKGYFLTINKVGLKTLGGTEEEIIGSHISKWLTSESYKIFEDRVRKICVNQPLEQPVVIEVITRNGEHKWGEVRTRLIRDGNRITGVHGIVRDITEKIRLEKELRESEAKYRELFENAQDVMYVVDTEGKVLKMNQIGLRILGCPKEEVIGSNISKWLTSEGRAIIQERRKKRRSGEAVKPIDILEIVCKNGEHRWVEINIRDIKEGEIHGIARDITENKRLKNELKESNKQLKLLWYLIGGTRGGGTRALILKQLVDKPHNANQIAEALDIDYKTARHHLGVLVKNEIVTKESNGYTAIYFLSKNMKVNLNEVNRELKQHNR
ncbi:Methyl sulfide methyltransferase-associated sensor [uncultured archaeon]|nr:Methyl sulfide methyltransferase-associated sensor [uncultured archaeon]